MEKTISKKTPPENDQPGAIDVNAERIRGYASEQEAYMALKADPPAAKDQKNDDDT